MPFILPKIIITPACCALLTECLQSALIIFAKNKESMGCTVSTSYTKNIVYVLIACLFAACAANPYSSTNKVYRQQAKALTKELRQWPARDSFQPAAYNAGTTNFNLRKPNFVIIHHTAQNSCAQTLQTFTKPQTQVSAHYIICKDGTVHHMLNDYLRAWHGGAAKWGSNTDINSSSIGIEMDNNGFEAFTEAQISSLLRVLSQLKKQYNIPVNNFIGHADIAPGRKVDPNRYFPWQQLALNGFGQWYDTTLTIVPAHFNALQGLRIIGYNIQDSAAAVYAFKLHFIQPDSSAAISDADRKVIVDLMNKYQ
jgi:N-acetylmuramoyl-L-alanine amidase